MICLETAAELACVCRYASESSVSLNRSPAQPSSYHSDEELMRTLDGLNGVGMDGLVSALITLRVEESLVVANHVWNRWVNRSESCWWIFSMLPYIGKTLHLHILSKLSSGSNWVSQAVLSMIIIPTWSFTYYWYGWASKSSLLIFCVSVSV